MAEEVTKSQTTGLSVTFWGVRGTLAAPGREFQRTGGNTICAEVRCGDRVTVLDAGTGIRELGSRLIEQKSVRKLDLFFETTALKPVTIRAFVNNVLSPEEERIRTFYQGSRASGVVARAEIRKAKGGPEGSRAFGLQVSGRF